MAEKNFNNVRIVNKHDTEAHWRLATNFTPKQGELIVYDIDDNYNYERIKIGDGVQNVNDLPFAAHRSFVVTVSRDAGNNTIVDKTYQEIYDAAKAGMYVYMVTGDTVYVDGNSMWPDTVLWLSYYSDYSVIFTHHDGSSEYEVEVDSDGGVSVYYSSSLPSKYSFGYEGMVLTVGENGEVNPADFPEIIARTTDVEEVKALVGDKSVSEQINAAVANNQSDWSVNDETSPTYVKNRPFYENIITTAILSDTTFEFTDYGDYCAVEDGLDITLTEGFEYQLKIDDVIYTSACGTFDGGIPYLGNLHVFNNTLEDTGESFVFFMEGTYFLCGTTEFSAGNHTIAISKSVREIKTVDEKYIPDTIARVSDIDEVKELVGDTTVSEQIAAAQLVYVGPDMPTDPNIKVWINTAEEGTGIVPVLPRVATITLAAANWSGSASPYSQVVNINTVTSATKVELNPTVSQIVSLQSDDIALMAENNAGIVTVYSFGDKPSADMTMQVTLTEVSYV